MALRLNLEVRIYHRQPMSSGATSSAGRAKKDGGRCWEGLVGYGSGLKAGDNALIKSSARTSKKRK